MKKNIYRFITTLSLVAVLGFGYFANAQWTQLNQTLINTNGQTNTNNTTNSTTTNTNGTTNTANSTNSTNTTNTSTNSNATTTKTSTTQQQTHNSMQAGNAITSTPITNALLGGTPSTSSSSSSSSSASSYSTPTPASAGIGKVQNPINVTSLSDFVAKVLGIILKIAIPVVAAFIIYSGLMFVLARGNSEKLEKAKTRLLYTLIGAGVLLGAWMIASVIKATIEALTA